MLTVIISVVASLGIVYLAGYHVAKRIYSPKPKASGGSSTDESSGGGSEAGKTH